jgi:hypothetical protein
MPGILVQIAEPHHWGDAYKFLSPLWGMTKVSPFLSESIPVRGGGRLKVKKSKLQCMPKVIEMHTRILYVDTICLRILPTKTVYTLGLYCPLLGTSRKFLLDDV